MGELMRDFDGMVALVTGGASGIGAATAALLADRGARTAVLDIDPEAGDLRHLRLACDVADRVAVARAVERVAGDLGRPAAPAALAVGGGGQHQLGGGHPRPPRPGPVRGQQGGRARPDPGHGRRPRRRRHPGQLRPAGHGRDPWVGRLLAAAADPEAELAALRARQPLGRLVSAGEVAAAIAYLASPQAGATTGTALTVDGGMTGLRLPAPGPGRR
jgi:2-keto-3-deoxy-L-fuconate dehydrogenase